MLDWAVAHAPGRRVWALEGTGSFAVGLVEVLVRAGEDVIQIGAVKRAVGAKNDQIDAVRAARQALSSGQPATPRPGGLREAIRMTMTARQGVLVGRTKAIDELKSLIVVAPEHLRAQLRGQSSARQLDVISRMRTTASAPVAQRVSVQTMKLIAARIRFLSAQVAQLDPELLNLLQQHPAGPALLADAGVGPVVAAQLLISWSHVGRVRNEAAFAALAGTSPL
jgi:transposase